MYGKDLKRPWITAGIKIASKWDFIKEAIGKEKCNQRKFPTKIVVDEEILQIYIPLPKTLTNIFLKLVQI